MKKENGERILFLVFLPIVFCLSARSQSGFEKQDARYKEALEKRILQSAADNSQTKALAGGSSVITIASSYRFRYSSGKSLPDSNAVSLLIPDTFYSYGLFTRAGQLAAYAIKTGTFDFNVHLIDELDSGELKYNPAIRMIQKAATFSKTIFFVNLTNDEFKHDLIGFIENGRLKFVDTALHVYKNIYALVLNKFGSVRKYIELCRTEQAFKDYYSKMVPKQEDKKVAVCKKIVRSDYQEFIAMNEEDTGKAADLFISEMSSIIDLTALQRQLLKERMLDCLQRSCPSFVSAPGVPFLGKNIYSVVMSILTEDQYEKYTAQRRLNWQLAKAAAAYLQDYFRNKVVDKDEKFPSEVDVRNENVMFKHEVFGK
jgi:hypothetical protein